MARRFNIGVALPLSLGYVKRMAWWLFLILMLLHVADFASTIAVLRYEGGEEMNPIAVQMMQRFGRDAGLVWLKIAIIAQLAAWLWFVGPTRPLVVGLLIVIPVYAVVVANNVRNWLLARQEARQSVAES